MRGPHEAPPHDRGEQRENRESDQRGENRHPLTLADHGVIVADASWPHTEPVLV